MYRDDELLMLSGIQHFAFCRRQWALIHLEQQWADNLRTYEGQELHHKADQPDIKEKRGKLIISRAMPLVSYRLGVSGIADVVEFHQMETATDERYSTPLPNRNGRWIPYPVEYKRGKPKPDDWDHVQLCAQAMCLEEMMDVQIEQGALFYGQPERRERVTFTPDLRERVHYYLEQMRICMQQGMTPPAAYTKGCQSCSLQDICMPQMKNSSVSRYIQSYLN
ncbi:CRISPR-associated protein Cas4 [Paenibacillus campi]|uniref:CRISPR-associated protein Cas4 n=1 Tax=Paenibacillus campi TaxID=3106031 RepID=UPI002AFF9972|nr:CRISPR-associated protein Cas4 [Paenibacillus sp. SGZ-1009]